MRIPPRLKAEWEVACAEHKLPQNVAGESLVRWFVQQPPYLRALILAIIPHSDKLTALVMESIKERAEKYSDSLPSEVVDEAGQSHLTDAPHHHRKKRNGARG